MTILNTVSNVEEERVLQILRENKRAIGWTIAGIKWINLLLCMHNILVEKNFWPSIFQRRLNPNIKEVVRAEVLKLLDAGISILDST